MKSLLIIQMLLLCPILWSQDSTDTIQNKFDPLNPFRITMGANFDFQETVDASFYFDAMYYNPRLRPISFLEPKNKLYLGFYGSLYNSKYIVQDSVQRFGEFYSLLSSSADTVDLIRKNYQLGISNSVTNIGFEGGLTWGWFKLDKEKEYRSFSWILPELSTIHRRVHSEYSYQTLSADTLLNQPFPNPSQLIPEQQFINTRYDEVLAGFGFILDIRNKQYGDIMLKGTVGMSWYMDNGELAHRAYYAYRVQAIDPQYGVNLGGEIRGYYSGGLPYIAVYLSKSFGLKKIGELISK